MMCHPVTPPTPVVFIAYPTSLITVALHVALIAVLAWLVFYKRREIRTARDILRSLPVAKLAHEIAESRAGRRPRPKLPNIAKSSAAGNRADPPTRPGPAAGPRDGGAK